jgi:hypothetical protein
MPNNRPMLRADAMHRAILALGAAATVLFAEPTEISMSIGAPILAAGAIAWILAAGSDESAPEPRRGGLYARSRHPRMLAASLLAAGLVVWAASEEPRGRWVPRSVAPLGLLFLFLELLPRADAELRARLRLSEGDEGARYLEGVPSFRPRVTAWPGASSAGWSAARAFAPRALAPLVAVAALAYCCYARPGWTAWIGF